MHDNDDEPPLIASKHNGFVTKDGITVQVQIYRLPHTKWTLEVVDPENNSMVWDDEFATDDDAHAEFLRTVETEGITSLLYAPNRLLN